jgi:hypothetical protein
MLRHLSFKAGEFEVSVGVDQTRKKDCVIKLGCRDIPGTGNLGIRTNRLQPTICANQNCPTLERESLNRKQPACCQPSGTRVSAADLALAQFLP